MTTNSQAEPDGGADDGNATEKHPFEMRPSANAKVASRDRERNPLTIAFLFYVVTLGAILSASLRTLVGDEQATSGAFGVAFSLGAMLGIVAGLGLGFFYFRSAMASGMGLIAGILTGLVAGAISLVDSRHFVEISTLTFVGCWVLVLCMAFSARFKREH